MSLQTKYSFAISALLTLVYEGDGIHAVGGNSDGAFVMSRVNPLKDEIDFRQNKYCKEMSVKKTLIILSLVTVSGASMAQSSLVLFGVLDASVGTLRAEGAGHASGMMSGGNATSRLGFRGVEDLGGGYSASFWLEGQLQNDNGAGASQTTGFDFTRRSTISLAGRFGEVRLGRDFSPTFLNMIAFDTSANRGLGTVESYAQTLAGVAGANGTIRVNNAISYILPAGIGGFYGTVEYAFGERNSGQVPARNPAGISPDAQSAVTDKTGDFIGGRAGFLRGPFNISAAYSRFSDAVRTVGTSAFAKDYQIANFGTAYDFGFMRVLALWQQDKIGGAGSIAALKMDTFGLGASAPLGSGVVRAQFSRYDLKDTQNDANKVSVGYVYSLSKRTDLYTDLARINNQGSGNFTFANLSNSVISPVPNRGKSATGFAIGVKHVF